MGVFKIVILSLYAVIVVLALFGNTFILAAIIRNKKLHHPVYVFLANQSLSDLLFTILSFADAAYLIKGSWIYGDQFCQLQGTFMQVLYTMSILSLVGVAIERYVKICLLSTLMPSVRSCIKWCIFVNALSFLVCSPMLYSFTATEVERHKINNSSEANNTISISNTTCIINSNKTCRMNNTETSFIPATYICTTNRWSAKIELAFNVVHTLVAFVLPLSVLVLAHTKIYRKLSKNQEKQERWALTWSIRNDECCEEENDTSLAPSEGDVLKRREHEVRKKKVVEMLLVITTLFVLLWTPWFVTRLVKSVMDVQYTALWKIVQLIAFMSVISNFFIYVRMNRVFRRTFLSFFNLGSNRNSSQPCTPCTPSTSQSSS